MNTAEFKSATFPNAGPRHLLDDSVMEPHVPSRGQAESSTLSSGISIGRSFKHTCAVNGLLIKILACLVATRRDCICSGSILKYQFYSGTKLRNVGAERQLKLYSWNHNLTNYKQNIFFYIFFNDAATVTPVLLHGGEGKHRTPHPHNSVQFEKVLTYKIDSENCQLLLGFTSITDERF